MINTNLYPQGLLFTTELQNEIRNKFYNIDHDSFGKRIFFENSGGALRLKSCLDAAVAVDSQPDCPGRHQLQADIQGKVVKKGYEDLRIIFNTPKGSIVTCLSASQVMFNIMEAIATHIEGNNMVVSALEHPSGFDSVKYYAQQTGRELRVMKPNPKTGRIEVDEVRRLVDKNTVVLSCMYSSNTTGGVNDIPAIIAAAREIKPDIYIVVDAVQHAPHGLIDLQQLDIDAMDFAPYKFFACRGSGVGWVSDRCAKLPHNHILCYSDDTWELGSTAPHIFAGYSAIVEYVSWIGSHFIDSTDRRELFAEGIQRIELQERALLYRTLEGTDTLKGLRHIPNIRVVCDNPDLTQRDYILPIQFFNMDAVSAVKEYIKRGIYVFERKTQDYYSHRIVESLGVDSVIRVSPLHCNSPEEVDAFLKASAEIAAL